MDSGTLDSGTFYFQKVAATKEKRPKDTVKRPKNKIMGPKDTVRVPKDTVKGPPQDERRPMNSMRKRRIENADLNSYNRGVIDSLVKNNGGKVNNFWKLQKVKEAWFSVTEGMATNIQTAKYPNYNVKECLLCRPKYNNLLAQQTTRFCVSDNKTEFFTKGEEIRKTRDKACGKFPFDSRTSRVKCI